MCLLHTTHSYICFCYIVYCYVYVDGDTKTFVTGAHDQLLHVWQWEATTNSIRCLYKCAGHEFSVENVACSPDKLQVCVQCLLKSNENCGWHHYYRRVEIFKNIHVFVMVLIITGVFNEGMVTNTQCHAIYYISYAESYMKKFI